MDSRLMREDQDHGTTLASEVQPQFKAEAVQLVIRSERSIAEVAEVLESNPGTLGNWVQKLRQNDPKAEPGLSPADHGQLAAMDEQHRKLKIESEFLKSPRPSSPGSRTEREISPDRGGEGEVPDRLDMQAARRGALVVLCLARARRAGHRHPGPPRGTGSRDRTYLKRPARHRRVPAHRCHSQ